MEKKLLYTASTFSHIRNFHLPYLRHFQQRGWTIHVACGGGEEPIPYADRVIPLPLQKKMTSVGNLRAAARLRGLIRREGYDLISTHTALAAFFTRLSVKGMRSRPLLVNTVHGYLFDDDTPGVRRSILLSAERLTAPQTDLLLTMNRWDHALAQRRHLGTQVFPVPGMGVETERFRAEPAEGLRLREELGIARDAFVVMYPAEFSGRKNQQLLIRALAQLPQGVVLALPGQGSLRDECRQLAARLGLGSRVLFPGQVTDMGRWYAMADAAASASRIEGLPFNIMEAMFCGLPVAASEVKGHTDLIVHGESGWLYPHGDVKACAEALLALMESAELRNRLSAAARRQVEQYELERVLPQHVEHYQRLLVRAAGQR